MSASLVALLRGINVSGKMSIPMAPLRGSCEAIGLTQVHTYLQSGNIVFAAEHDHTARIAADLRARISTDFGHEVQVLVLTAQTLAHTAENNPLRARLGGEDKLFHATFLFEPVSEGDFQALQLPVQGDEQAVLAGQVLLLYCPHGYGKTKLNNGYFEKALGVPATTRNWRTVLALHQAAINL